MFFNLVLLFLLLQVIHCHYQSQASSMPSKEEWFTYDTTVFLHLNNHIHNQKKRNARKKTRKWWTFTAHNGISSHHLQPLFQFLFFWCVILICLDCQLAERNLSIRNRATAKLHSRRAYSRLEETTPANPDLGTLSVTAQCQAYLTSTVRRSAKWSHTAEEDRRLFYFFFSQQQQQHDNVVAPGCSLYPSSDNTLPPCFRFFFLRKKKTK